MGLSIGKQVTTPIKKEIQKKERSNNKKQARKRVAGIDYAHYGNELTQKKGELTHVEFLPRTEEGIRFSTDGHFAIKYYNDSPIIELYIAPKSFQDNKLNITSDTLCLAYPSLEGVKLAIFDYVGNNKDKFLVQ